VFDLTPDQNPAYVKSEMAAARQEMGDEEYETEFEGKMVAYEGMKFYAIKQPHLQPVRSKQIGDCVYVLGVDQGPKNFGACLLAYDGQTVYAIKDYFETSFKTIQTHMVTLMNETPIWIRARGGVPGEWQLTIFDSDPSVHNILIEMEEMGTAWPTDVTFRHDNKKQGGLSEDWRKETTIFINEMAKQGNLIFCEEEGPQLHDECMRVENVSSNPLTDAGGGRNKGWKISGSWRKDHVLDAFIMAMWTILIRQLHHEKRDRHENLDPNVEAMKAARYRHITTEREELRGYGNVNKEEIFEQEFGRKRALDSDSLMGVKGYYSDY